MCPLFFTLPLPSYLKKWFGGRVAINKKKNFQLTISLSISLLSFSAITFSFSAAVIISSCGSIRTDLLPSGLMLYELGIPFILRADKQNLSLVSTTHCSFKRRRPCTYKWRSLFWIHRGRRHPEQRHGDPDTFLNKQHI